MKKIILTSVLLLAGLFILSAQSPDTRHVSVDAGLMVFDRRIAADRIAAWGKAQGGYFTWKSDDAIVLRVPDRAVKELRDFLGEIGDGILHYGSSESDLREELLRVRSALEAREEVLERNKEILDSTDVEGTLELEKEMRRLMSEIDAARGRLIRLEHDSRMALIHIALSFRQQTVPVERPSRFEWLNQVNFYDFLEGYGGGSSRRILTSPIDLPEGFARIRRSRNFEALSPEGLRLRVRRMENYPVQNSQFWKEALVHDLGVRGYVLVDDSDMAVGGKGDNFLTALWALPVGSEDHLYLTGIRVKGKYLEVLEISGEAELFSEYFPLK